MATPIRSAGCWPRRRPARCVRAADGSVLAVLHGDQDRAVVPLSAVPMTVRDAVLAIEDARFYAHGALDLRGIARAAVADVASGHIRQGGSDLTQQYVKNVVTGDRRSLHRKLVEALDAIQLQRHLSKDQILAAYLNRVYFGDGVYGIAAAAEHYFSRPVGRLTLAQAAALAGTIANPGRFRPTAGPAARARRDQVLDRMAAVGFASPARVAAAKRQPLRPRLHREAVHFPYFVDDVTRALLDDHALDRALGPAGSAARRRAVFEGGLRVATTLSPADQHLAEQAVAGRLAGVGLGGALVSLDPASGAVVAMVGGRDFASSKVNLATGQGGGGFPPGSSFKVFYLVAALEQGIPASTSFDTASPTTVTAPACPAGYSVHNAEPASPGRIALAQATAESVNTYYAQLMVRVGTANAIRVARRMGITSPLRDYCSLVLGTENVTPLELASAYATLAAGGSTASRPPSPGSPARPAGSCSTAGPPAAGSSTHRWRRPPSASCAGSWGRAGPATGPPSAGPWPARPAPPPASPTPGSPASPPSWPPRSGSATRSGRPRCAPSSTAAPSIGGTFPALIFHDYMAAALAAPPRHQHG